MREESRRLTRKYPKVRDGIVPKDHIYINEDTRIEWEVFDYAGLDEYNLDPVIEPLDKLLGSLETRCIRACCGFDAFSFLPADIQVAQIKLNIPYLKDRIQSLRESVDHIEASIVCSFKINGILPKQVFIQLLDHILLNLKSYSEESEASEEATEFYYFEDDLMVMTEAYHKSRGFCCGSKCRHCPYDYVNVPKE